MRILRYKGKIQLEPYWVHDLFPEQEIREKQIPGSPRNFDKLVMAVKRAGFDYTVVSQPDEVLIERRVKSD